MKTDSDTICNKCGSSCKSKLHYDKSEKDFYGLIEVTVRGHYFSEHLCDLLAYTFSLCEKCLVELFDTFKITVTKEEEEIVGKDGRLVRQRMTHGENE